MKLKLFYIAIVLFTMSIIGCYTVLQHPNVELTGKDGTVYDSRISYYDDCSSCHSDISEEDAANMTAYDIVKTHLQEDDSEVYNNRDFFGYGYSWYYGSYDYYYNSPWWTQYTPAVKEGESNYEGSARNNDSGRESTSDRRSTTRFTAPPVSTSSSSSSTSSSVSSSSSSSTSESGTQTTRKASSSSNTRSSSDAPASRNNDGNRSSDTGRKR